MNKKLTMLSAAFGVMLFSHVATAARDEPDVEVEVTPDEVCTSTYCQPFYKYTVSAIEDSVYIKKVVVNRGNCGNDTVGKRGDVSLKYGQEWEFKTVTNDTYTKCKPRELLISTSTGDWVFNW